MTHMSVTKIKDLILLGAAIWTAGEALQAAGRE
jgi:hypothetical protein